MIDHIIYNEELNILHKEGKVDIQVQYKHQSQLSEEIVGNKLDGIKQEHKLDDGPDVVLGSKRKAEDNLKELEDEVKASSK